MYLVNFKHYYHLIKEGGNVFKSNPTQRVMLANVGPTINLISEIVGIDLSKNLLGSTGKRESSGDLDIAIPENKLSKKDLIKRLTNWVEERNLNPKDYIAKSGISVHFRTPIAHRDTEYVQTDFMFVPNVKFAQFALSNDEESPFKGKHRSIVMANLAKNQNMTWSGIGGLKDRMTKVVIDNTDPNNIAKLLLDDQNANAKNLFNIKSILNFLVKKHKNIGTVLNLVDEARQTILTDGADIMSLVHGPIKESSTAEGYRIGVQHLYSQYKPEQYSMSFENFETLLNALNNNNGIIQPGNSTVSEKADGMAVRFGLTTNNEFFLQGSYSGQVIDGDFEGKIKHKPTQTAFENNFNKIKSLVYKTLLRYKKELDLEGIRVQAEWLYSPFALSREDNDNMVYFVATNYMRDKLGTWSTFPIINITDNKGNELSGDIKQNIIKSLIDLSNKEVKFLPLDINAFTPIDLSSDVHRAIQEIRTFKSQYPDYQQVLNNPSRKRQDQQAKADLRKHIIKVLLPYQQRMHEKILKVMSKIAGKLGEYEGLIIKLTQEGGEPFMFKIISPTFHKNKGRI